ncbi:MoxR family ATPase [Luteolibacter yonseiensis]
MGDRRDGRFYRYGEDLKLAIRVALIVGRPLLLYGPSGCGKSSMVFNLARIMGRRYYEFVVHSRTEAKELLYRFDAIRRLGEAHLGGASLSDEAEPLWRSPYPFIEPGSLWWALDPLSAGRRGLPAGENDKLVQARDPGWSPVSDGKDFVPAIVLIDEIDKADIDFPNNLLVPLGSRQFSIEESGENVRFSSLSAGDEPFVIITSNQERELPEAFVRRCVVCEISPPSDEDLMELAQATFRQSDEQVVSEWRLILDILRRTRGAAVVSPAEFIDSIKAVAALGTGDQSRWREIILHTSWHNSYNSQ